MDRISAQHGLQLGMPVDQILVVFEVDEVVVDRVVDEGRLALFSGDGLFEAQEVRKLLVY